MIFTKYRLKDFKNFLWHPAPSYITHLYPNLSMRKAMVFDLVSFMASMVFFTIIAFFLMIAYVITFRRKDNCLLPG